MSESDYAEFGIAHDRVYTLEHLWLQSFDVKSRSKHEEDQVHVKIGLSEFLRAEYGDIVRIVLPHPQESGNFTLDVDEDSDVEQLSSVAPPLAGDEIGLGELLITVRTTKDRILINAPFSNLTATSRIIRTSSTMRLTAMAGASSSIRTISTRINSSMSKSTSRCSTNFEIL